MLKHNNTCGRYLSLTTSSRAKQLIACCALSISHFGAANAQTPQRDSVKTL